MYYCEFRSCKWIDNNPNPKRPIYDAEWSFITFRNPFFEYYQNSVQEVRLALLDETWAMRLLFARCLFFSINIRSVRTKYHLSHKLIEIVSIKFFTFILLLLSFHKNKALSRVKINRI